MAKTRKFECPAGKRLNKLAKDARHDDNNIMKIRLNDPRTNDQPAVEAAWGYNLEHKRRYAEEGNVSMSKEDCHTTCCNMYSMEVMAHKHYHCQFPDHCKCWDQICDDVYDTHGHDRPTEEGTKALIELLKKGL